MTYYNELLTLCGFDEAEIKSQQQRIEKVWKILELGPKDMERAVARVRENFDIELRGVRKLLGLWLKELFDIVLCREEGKKVIYLGYPPFQYIGAVIQAAKEASKKKDDLYVGCPEVVLCQTLGQIFNKHVPLLEVGEAAGLPPGHAMCSLLQIRVAALVKGILPLPDMAISTSFFCDMGPKVDELLQHKYGYYVEYVDNCMDGRWGAWPDFDREQAWYLGAKLNKLFDTLKNRFGLEINEDIWQKGRNHAGKFYVPLNKLTQYLTAVDPMPLGPADFASIWNIPSACAGVAMEEGAKTLEILLEEVNRRVEEGVGVIPKGSPKVFILLQSFVDPTLNRLIGEVGLAGGANPSPVADLPSPYSYATLGEKRAEKSLFTGPPHSSYGMAKWVERDAKSAADLDGILYSFPFSCRPFACNSKLMKLHLEKETGLPVLLLDMDLYDDRNYSAAALRTRLEAFAEMLKAKKAQTKEANV